MDGTGDIAPTATEELQAIVATRWKAGPRSWKLYTIGAGFDSMIGSSTENCWCRHGHCSCCSTGLTSENVDLSEVGLDSVFRVSVLLFEVNAVGLFQKACVALSAFGLDQSSNHGTSTN
jgi:hypothetical protein